jgi:hypothetical protein
MAKDKGKDVKIPSAPKGGRRPMTKSGKLPRAEPTKVTGRKGTFRT